MKLLLLFLFLTSANLVFSQTTFKTLAAKKTAIAPKIDGIIDDEVWKNAPLANHFVAFQPVPYIKEGENRRTEVYILYDDQAIYLAAKMYELSNDDISHELTNRDQIGNADFINIILDSYNDKINAQEFVVTAAGVQFDAKFSAQGEDDNWNAVWESAVKITGNVWTAEMKIPYSALRFANKDIQNWGLNIVRSRQKFQQKLTWNEIDPKKNGFINQEGELVGIEKIKSPLRLSFSPYVSSYVNHYPFNQPGVTNTTNSFNGGMDVKYGINASFTLDMTLIPDFGQVQSDNQILNLTPFEVRYSENRQFFTEGTELFNKGDLFYSRRIGSSPINAYKFYNQLGTNDKIITNPSQTKLLNATKISGRTAKGLGIGFFNAVSKSTAAVLEHPDGTRETVEISPLSNYNILVLDQNLKNNSSISLINASVIRSGNTYDANVSALVFDLNTKNNTYNLNGSAKMSQLFGGDFTKPNVGYSYEINPGKRSGNFNYNYSFSLVDDKYDPNDLGILFNNNFITNSFNLSYNWYKSTKLYNKLNVYLGTEYTRRFNPNTYQSTGIYASSYIKFTNLWSANINLDFGAEGNDFYEPRTAGRFYKDPKTKGFNFNVSSNSSKKLSANVFFGYRARNLFNATGYNYESSQRFRVNNKLSFKTSIAFRPRNNYAGYIKTDLKTKEILFSRRDISTVENSLSGKYTFNNKMGLNITTRHYWSKLNNKEFYVLSNEGRLIQPSPSTPDLDRNFNAFNVDMVYLWRFAPGSELSIAWKEASLNQNNGASANYFKNLDGTLNQPQNNNFSVKILYYIDYLQLKKSTNC